MILNPAVRVRILSGDQYTTYEASITAHGLPEPSSLRGSTLGTRTSEQKGAVIGACKLIDGCSLVLCSTTASVVSAGICHRNEVNVSVKIKIVSFTLHRFDTMHINACCRLGIYMVIFQYSRGRSERYTCA